MAVLIMMSSEPNMEDSIVFCHFKYQRISACCTKSIGEAKDCQTVSAVVTYDHPATGDTYMLVFHQAIMVPNLNSNLLCPNQMGANELRLNDKLKHFID